MSTLERAIAIAAEAHAGQVDKAGEPYLLHPLRLMLQMETLAERIVAALHDVVEDSDWTIEDLRQEAFSEEILDAIESVTRRNGEAYGAFVARAGTNPIGRNVKLADLRDNSDLRRIPNPTERDLARVRKYERAIVALEARRLKSSE